MDQKDWYLRKGSKGHLLPAGAIAGVGLPGVELMLLQDRMVAKDNGADPQAVERLMVYVRHFYEIVVGNKEGRIELCRGKIMIVPY